jgi:hypothetical protein
MRSSSVCEVLSAGGTQPDEALELAFMKGVLRRGVRVENVEKKPPEGYPAVFRKVVVAAYALSTPAPVAGEK